MLAHACMYHSVYLELVMVVLTIVGQGTRAAVELTVPACEDTAGTLECAGDR